MNAITGAGTWRITTSTSWRRPSVCFWTMRYGADLKTPLLSILGPKVMLIDETAVLRRRLVTPVGMFRKFKLGPLVGKAHLGRPGRKFLATRVLLDGAWSRRPIWLSGPEERFRDQTRRDRPGMSRWISCPSGLLSSPDGTPNSRKRLQIVLPPNWPRIRPRLPRRPPFPVRVRR